MSKMKNLLLVLVSVALVAAIAIGGTVAYISDSDEDVSVMTSGDVKIQQNVYQRDGSVLVPFVQNGEAYPAVYGLSGMPALEANDSFVIGFPETDSAVSFYAAGSIYNAIDKIVSVKNTGSNSAYLRTLVLLPAVMRANYTNAANLQVISGVTYRGATYDLLVFTYGEALAAGVEALPSLLQIYVEKTVTQEQIAAYLNDEGQLLVPAISQAVQITGFESFGADVALNEAFGLLSATSNPWVPVEQKWDGDPDTGWYLESRNEFTLTTAGQLAGLAELVNSGVTFAGKTVKLGLNIDLNNQDWTPISLRDGGGSRTGEFAGTFDGCGHTVYNLKVNTPAGPNGAGLFGAVCGTVKNLTVENATVSGLIIDSNSGAPNGIGVIVGSTNNGAKIDNVHVKNATVSGNRYLGGIVGYMDGDLTNCSVTDITLTATPDLQANGTYDNGDKVGGVVGYLQGPGNCGWTSRKLSGNAATNVTIKAYRDVGGILGAGYLGGTNSISDPVVFENNTVNGLDITIDQLTGCYGLEDTNAGAILGRLLGIDYTVSNTNTATDVNIDDDVDFIVANPTTAQDVIDAAAAGSTIYFLSGEYDYLTLLNAKNNLTLIGLDCATLGYFDVNGTAGVTLQNFTFDASKARTSSNISDTKVKNDPTTSFLSNIADNSIKAGTGAKPGACDLIIRDCIFTGTAIDMGLYTPIHFNEQGRKGVGAYDITIEGCKFLCNAFEYLRLQYMEPGTVTIKGNIFGGETYTTEHHAILMSATSSDVVLTGNTFVNWAPAKTAISLGRHTGYEGMVDVQIKGNTFKNTLTAGGDGVIELKIGQFKTDKDSLTFEGNTFEGGLAGYTEATVPQATPWNKIVP